MLGVFLWGFLGGRWFLIVEIGLVDLVVVVG